MSSDITMVLIVKATLLQKMLLQYLRPKRSV